MKASSFRLFYLIIFCFFRWVLGWSRHFYIGVVELAGLLPGNTGIQLETSNYGGNNSA